MSNDLLYKESVQKNRESKYFQLLVPRSLKKDVLGEVHNGVMGGHFGCRKTLEKVKIKYYWYEMKNDVNSWVLSYDQCDSDKTPHKLPVTPRNNRYILVVTDHFTKWVEIFAVLDQTAVTTANVILNEVIARYGSPLAKHSDSGPTMRVRYSKNCVNLWR